jgi:proliferating cell nuclear antigen
MIVKLNNPKMFSDVISILSDIVTEVKIKANKEGLSIIAVDPANVAMTILKIPASAFSQLEVEEETIGIELEGFKAVLRRCSSGSSLIMKTEDNFINIEVFDKVKREFTLSLIDLERKDKPIPALDFSARVEIGANELIEAIEDCSIVADSCTFESSPNNFAIYAKGSLNSAKLAYTSDEVYIESPNTTKSKYSLEYLQKMIKASKLVDKIALNFSNNYPLKIDFNNSLMGLSFILAPRVETED